MEGELCGGGQNFEAPHLDRSLGSGACILLDLPIADGALIHLQSGCQQTFTFRTARPSLSPSTISAAYCAALEHAGTPRQASTDVGVTKQSCNLDHHRRAAHNLLIIRREC